MKGRAIVLMNPEEAALLVLIWKSGLSSVPRPIIIEDQFLGAHIVLRGLGERVEGSGRTLLDALRKAILGIVRKDRFPLLREVFDELG